MTVIRLAIDKDILFLRGVEQSAANAFRILSDYIDSGSTVAFELLNSMVADKNLWVAVTSADIPVGFVGCRDMAGLLYIHEISVAIDHQKQGIGRRLMLNVLNDVANRGYSVAGLTTRRDVPWNMPFYKSLGFVEVKAAKDCPIIFSQLQKEIEEGADPTARCAMIKKL